MLYAHEEDGKVLIVTPVGNKFKPKKGWLAVKPKDLPTDDTETLAIVDGILVVDETRKDEKRHRDVRKKRRAKYEPIPDQIDVILKQFKAFEAAGMQLLPETEDLLARWQKVKDDNPLN